MTIFIALLKNDIKLFAKDWKAMVLLLLLPFLCICLFVYALSPLLDKSSFIEPFSIALVDKEDTVQTRILGKQLDEMDIFKEVMRVQEDKAEELIKENKIAAAIIIPPQFSDSVAVGENKPVTVIGNKAMRLQSHVVRNLVQSASNIVTAGQSAINTIYYFNEKAGLKGEDLEREFNNSTMKFFIDALARNEVFAQNDSPDSYNLTPAEYYTAALIVIFLMFSGMPGMKMLIWERSLGLSRRLAASPARPWQRVLSKFLVSLMLAVMQFATIVIMTVLIFKNYWGSPVKNILLLFAGIVFAVSAWSVFVSAAAGTPAAADAVGNLGILLMAVIGGSIYPLNAMPDFVKSLSGLTINKWAMDGFMIIFSGNDALSVTKQFNMLLVIGAALLIISAVVLKLKRG